MYLILIVKLGKIADYVSARRLMRAKCESELHNLQKKRKCSRKRVRWMGQPNMESV